MVGVEGALRLAGCDTVTTPPEIFNVLLRAAPLFAANGRNLTVPLPVPELPAVTVIHGALPVAVHAQVLADVVTTSFPFHRSRQCSQTGA